MTEAVMRFPKKAVRRPTKRHLMKWCQNMEMSAGEELKKYSSWESYYQGDFIDHDRFGQGRVQSCFGNKIEVIFEDKMRILVHRLVF